MRRRCFMCDVSITGDSDAPWAVVVLNRSRRRFFLWICLSCLGEFEPPEYWYALEQIHAEEGRDISAAL